MPRTLGLSSIGQPESAQGDSRQPARATRQTLTAVIDAQAAKDPTTAYTSLRMAYAHMPMVANALTDGIIQQFPAKFGEALVQPAATAVMTDTMTMTGTESMTSTEPMTGTGMMTSTESMTIPGAITGTEMMTGPESMTGTTPVTSAAPTTAIMTAPMLRANLDMLLGEHVLLAASATEAAFRGRQDEFAAAAATSMATPKI